MPEAFREAIINKENVALQWRIDIYYNRKYKENKAWVDIEKVMYRGEKVQKVKCHCHVCLWILSVLETLRYPNKVIKALITTTFSHFHKKVGVNNIKSSFYSYQICSWTKLQQ